MNKFCFLFFLLIQFVGCALPPSVDNSGQEFVPEQELLSLRFASKGMDDISRGRLIQGEILTRKALYLTPESEKIKFNLGMSLYQQSRFDEAYDIFKPLYEQDSINQSYSIWLVRTIIEQGSISEAEKFIQSRIKLSILNNDWTSAVAFSRTLANAKMRIGDFDGALCASQQTINNSLNGVELLKHIKLLMQSGRLKSAEWFLLNSAHFGLTAAVQGQIDYQLRLAELYLLQNKIQEAKIISQSILARGSSLDSTIAYEIKLLITAVGLELNKTGEQVALTYLDNEDTFNELVLDPRRKFSPLDSYFSNN